MRNSLDQIELCLGSEKKVFQKEKKIRLWARRSIVSINNIKKGEKFTTENLWSKRPGTGIPSKNLYKVIGKKAKRNILKDKLISNRDF